MYAEIYIKDELLVTWEASLFNICYANAMMAEMQPTLQDRVEYCEEITALFLEAIKALLHKYNISRYTVFIFFPSKMTKENDEDDQTLTE